LTNIPSCAKISSMKKQYIECGRACSPHGVRGLIKVEPWCDSPKVLADAKRVFLAEKDGSYKELTVTQASVGGRFVLMGFSGIDSREAAQAYKNVTLYLKREDIPMKKGAVLLSDLIGLNVINVDTGRVYGTVEDITDAVRGRLYAVKTDDVTVLIPDVPEFIIRLDADEGVFIRPIEGFFKEI